MKIRIELSLSKLVAIYIALASTLYAFIKDSDEVIIVGFSIAAAMFGNKQWQDARKIIKSKKAPDDVK